jgi:sugar O-acyltransferase (sialic acid O-acetyltransferase NeuD family)
MARVIIFGVQDFAALAEFYLRHDSEHAVVAFSVSREYLPDGRQFLGYPVIPFEEIERTHHPTEYSFFAPMSPRRMNRVRQGVYEQIKAKGYPLITYISSKATIWPETEVGDNCFILEDNTIQPFTRIGNNVVFWSGNHIGHHSVVEDHVMLTSHVVVSGHCRIGAFAYLGVNSTVRDGLQLAEGTLVGMATAIERDTEPWSVYQGNPAIKRKASSKDLKL